LGYLVVHNAFTANRIQSLLAAVDRLIDRALAGDCEIGWIDKDSRLPARVGHLLHSDKYDHAYADWLGEDLAPHIERLLGNEPVRHSLFGMLASGGGQPYCQSWHRICASREKTGRKHLSSAITAIFYSLMRRFCQRIVF